MFDRELEFPILKDRVFLNHAAVAPLPERSAEAMRRWTREAQTEVGGIWPDWAANLRKTRVHLAGLLNCTSDEIAFAHNTTHGLLCIANSLTWRPGDNVLIAEHEFPANVHPWRNLRRLGVEIRIVPETDRRYAPADFERLMDDRTRLVSISLVQYASGYRMPVEAIGMLCRERGVLFCLDGIQGVGAMPVNVEEIGCDFLVADGHKWMLSAEGLALLFVRKSRLELFNDSMTGWAGRRIPGNYEDIEQPLRPMAMRFEEGSHAMALAMAMGKSIELLQEVGITEVWDRIEALNAYLTEGLEARNFRIESPREGGSRSGIVAFSGPWDDPKSWIERLQKQQIFIASRRGWLRVSPHFYNDESQLDRFLGALEALL